MTEPWKGDEEEARQYVRQHARSVDPVPVDGAYPLDPWAALVALIRRAREHEREKCLGRHVYTCATCATEVRTQSTATTILCPECTWRDMEARAERAEALLAEVREKVADPWARGDIIALEALDAIVALLRAYEGGGDE